MTVETVFNKRIFVFFIMEMKTRKIVQHGITANPNMGFVRNQLTGFIFDREEKETYLIHDNSGELKWMDYASVGIKGVSITPYSPDMNSYAERFVRSARQELLDHFVIFQIKHLRNLMKAYVYFYNFLRPHQGRGNKTPIPNEIPSTGNIRKIPILFGLQHHYYRKAS